MSSPATNTSSHSGTWAAPGKDPGFGPAAILEAAARSGRYSAEEVGQPDFEGATPDAGELGRAWHRRLDAANEIVALLPPDDVGTCVLEVGGGLVRANASELVDALRSDRVRFHRGSIRRAWPQLVDAELD